MSWHVLIILCHNAGSANVPSLPHPLLLPEEATRGVGRRRCCTEITKDRKGLLFMDPTDALLGGRGGTVLVWTKGVCLCVSVCVCVCVSLPLLYF
uniref:Uncharacterized protein n=1 Tax=Rhipicephalus zambeziensis TaxID=60191 RepID=A0A224YHB9_9ACAR